MDSTALAATPSGELFSDWIQRRGVSKSTAYGWRSALGIEPERRRVGSRVEVWLTDSQVALLDAYGEALARGLSASEALAAVGGPASPMDSSGPTGIVPMESTGLAPMDSDGVHWNDPADSDDSRLQRLHARLAALRDAVELGAPLSTTEVALLLGARPGGDQVVRGRLRAVRERRNVWTIEPD